MCLFVLSTCISGAVWHGGVDWFIGVWPFQSCAVFIVHTSGSVRTAETQEHHVAMEDRVCVCKWVHALSVCVSFCLQYIVRGSVFIAKQYYFHIMQY